MIVLEILGALTASALVLIGVFMMTGNIQFGRYEVDADGNVVQEKDDGQAS